MANQRPTSGEPRRRRLSRPLESLVQAETLLQVAFVLPAAVVIGWLAGAWADRHWHQSWMAIAGILFGGISGLYYLIRMATEVERGLGPGGRGRTK